MSYDYRKQRECIFTDDGQRLFLVIRDRVHEMLAESGAFVLDKVVGHLAGDSWDQIACVDRLAELGEIREIPQGPVAGQDRVFVRGSGGRRL